MTPESEASALEEASRTLRPVAAAMAGGVALLAGAALQQHLAAAGRVPSPGELRQANALTALSMAAAFTMTIASEFLWRVQLRAQTRPLSWRVQTGFVLRAACREGAALLGGVSALLAARSGVLRAYPAYWVDLVPCALFFAFLAAHWPSAACLEAERASARPDPTV